MFWFLIQLEFRTTTQTAAGSVGPWASDVSGRRVNLHVVAMFVYFRFETVELFR
jgi:hypothetical protein